MSCPQNLGAPGVGLIITGFCHKPPALMRIIRAATPNLRAPCLPPASRPLEVPAEPRGATLFGACVLGARWEARLSSLGVNLSAAAAVKPLVSQARWLD